MDSPCRPPFYSFVLFNYWTVRIKFSWPSGGALADPSALNLYQKSSSAPDYKRLASALMNSVPTFAFLFFCIASSSFFGVRPLKRIMNTSTMYEPLAVNMQALKMHHSLLIPFFCSPKPVFVRFSDHIAKLHKLKSGSSEPMLVPDFHARFDFPTCPAAALLAVHL